MKLQDLLLLVSPIALTACAGQTWRANAGPMFVRAKGEVALQAAGQVPADLGARQNSLDGNLGLGDTEVTPYLRGETDIDRHRIRLDGFLLDQRGSGTVNGGYGGILNNTQVTSSLEFYAITTSYGYQLLREENYRVAIGAKLGFYSLDVAARSTPGREEVVTSVLVPMPFAEVEYFVGPVSLGASGGIMSADLGDANGRYVDLEGYAKWQATDEFDLSVGYRYLLLDGAGRASSRDFDADIDVQGVFISGGIRF